MARTIKKSLYILSGIIACILMIFSSSPFVSALEFDFSSAGKPEIVQSSSYITLNSGVSVFGKTSSFSSNSVTLTVPPRNKPNTLNLHFNNRFKAGTLISFYVYFGNNNAFDIEYATMFSGTSTTYVLEQNYIPISARQEEGNIRPTGTGTGQYTTDGFTDAYIGVEVKCLLLRDTQDLYLWFSQYWPEGAEDKPTITFDTDFIFTPGSFIATKSDDTSVLLSEILENQKNASDQAHMDSQAQLDWDKQQAEKEEQQRKEDENKANQTGSDSQSSSDDSQKELDSASKGLFDILTSFVGAITGASPGTCSISGDFGFFNAGNINLCTGASKITPVTNVVGSVMLIALIISACITLLHRFIELYNEVTS